MEINTLKDKDTGQGQSITKDSEIHIGKNYPFTAAAIDTMPSPDQSTLLSFYPPYNLLT